MLALRSMYGGFVKCIARTVRDSAGVEYRRHALSGGRSLRSDHRLPNETPPALEGAADHCTRASRKRRRHAMMATALTINPPTTSIA